MISDLHGYPIPQRENKPIKLTGFSSTHPAGCTHIGDTRDGTPIYFGKKHPDNLSSSDLTCWVTLGTPATDTSNYHRLGDLGFDESRYIPAEGVSNEENNAACLAEIKRLIGSLRDSDILVLSTQGAKEA